jgi:hypothetical protein
MGHHTEWVFAGGLLVLCLGADPSPVPPAGGSGRTGPVLEWRSYHLRPGSRAEFHRLVEQTVPLLRKWRVEVVAYGPSLHDTTSYYLIRAFPGVLEREQQEAAFYGSADWREGPRAQVLALIESYTTVVIPSDDLIVEALRRTGSPGPSRCATPAASDARVSVERLNREYIAAASRQDWTWFRDHLAESAVVVLGSGRRLEKEAFLELVRGASGARTSYELRNVTTRVYGPTAQVDADAPWVRADGTRGISRYVDTYSWLECRWQVISAQITLLPPD